MTTRVFNRRALFPLAAAMFACVAVPHPARADNGAVEPIRQLTDGLTRIMKAGHSTSFSQRFDMFAPVIDQTFDLTAILKASVGTAWDTLSRDQQATLLKAFRSYTVASYVNGFDDDSERLVVNPQPRTDGDEQIVRVRIIPSAGEEHKLDHVLQRGPTGWRVVDILADGAISRVAVQRSDFRQLMRQGGVSALTQSLENKSVELAD